MTRSLPGGRWASVVVPLSFFGASLQPLACGAKHEGAAPPDPPDIPCDAKRVLEIVCQHCHSDPPMNGAPFPLVTYEDTQASFRGQTIAFQMLYVLQNGKMPLPPVTIEPADRDTLIRWLQAGAPTRPAPQNCPPVMVPMFEAGHAGDDAAADAPDDPAMTVDATADADLDSGTPEAADPPDTGRESESAAEAEAEAAPLPQDAAS